MRPLVQLAVSAAIAFLLVVPTSELRASGEAASDGTITFQSDPQPIAIDTSKGVIFLRVEAGGRMVWALFDNGADDSVIDVGLARELGLDVGGRRGRIRTTHSSTRRTLVRGASLTLPGQFGFSGELDGADLGPASAALARDIGIILGMDMLGDLACLVDAPRRLIQCGQSGSVAADGRPAIALFRQNEGLISTTINGRPAQLELDLGNNRAVTIYRKPWRRLLAGSREVAMGRTFDMSGRTVRSTGARAVPVSLPPYEMLVDIQKTGFEAERGDGMLGFELFADKLTLFDFGADTITIFGEPN